MSAENFRRFERLETGVIIRMNNISNMLEKNWILLQEKQSYTHVFLLGIKKVI